MKIFIVASLLVLMATSIATAAMDFVDQNSNTFYTTDASKVVDDSAVDDPFKDWATNLVQGVSDKGTNLYDNITTMRSEIAKNETTAFISRVVNYIIWLLGLISTLYLLWSGFKMVTAAWDDGKYSSGFEWVKYSLLAIAGLGLSWFIVSFILYVFQTAAP